MLDREPAVGRDRLGHNAGGGREMPAGILFQHAHGQAVQPALLVELQMRRRQFRRMHRRRDPALLVEKGQVVARPGQNECAGPLSLASSLSERSSGE